MASSAPVITDILYEDLLDDPYPIFKRIRDTAPAVFVAAANLTLITRFDDIMRIERDPATYSSVNPASLVNKVMGPTFMRKDGAEHTAGRKAIEPSFRPGTIKEHWTPTFAAISDRLIEFLVEAGEADLFPALAAPMASLCLMEMIGFREMPWETLASWSQSLIDGAGNYSGDAEIERKAMEAGAGIDAAIDAVLDHHRAQPNPSILSSMVHADPPMLIEEIRANIKVIIGGGLNEPRDAILTLTFGLLANPGQKQSVLATPACGQPRSKNLYAGFRRSACIRAASPARPSFPAWRLRKVCRLGSASAQPTATTGVLPIRIASTFSGPNSRISHLALERISAQAPGSRGRSSAGSWRQCCSNA